MDANLGISETKLASYYKLNLTSHCMTGIHYEKLQKPGNLFASRIKSARKHLI